MMQASHEVPLSLLRKSRKFNDYDYALVHLFEECPKYYKFFEKSLKKGRKVILDNSLFELGEAFNEVKFVNWINKLKPTEYVVPDVWEDSKGTIKAFESWKKFKNVSGIKIGVVHGKTYKQLKKCYEYMSKNADKIAISFGYSYYKKQHPDENDGAAFSYGRIKLINRLIRDKVINRDKPHHLLGIGVPQEVAYYGRTYDFIESMDTSNPVVAGLEGIKYGPYGLESKPKIKLIDLFYNKIVNKKIIMFNIKKFRSFLQ